MRSEEIKRCLFCNCKFNSLKIYKRSKYYKKFCSKECQYKYFSKENPMKKLEIKEKLPKKKGNCNRQNKIIECYYNKKGCLINTSHARDTNGYPIINRDGKRWRMSRWVFFINYGFLPEIVMHTCDNPSCINPLHLIAGNIKSNSLDMVKKGRAPKGNYGKPKLKEEQAKEIKKLLKEGELSLEKIGKKFNVSKRTVLFIKQNKHWKHIN